MFLRLLVLELGLSFGEHSRFVTYWYPVKKHKGFNNLGRVPKSKLVIIGNVPISKINNIGPHKFDEIKVFLHILEL